MVTHPSLAEGFMPCGPSVIINNVLSHFQKCLSLDDRLYGYPRWLGGSLFYLSVSLAHQTVLSTYLVLNKNLSNE